MPTATLTAPELAERIVDGWLTGAPIEGWDDPAGPLFPAGEFAAYELTMPIAGTQCSICTGSRTTIACC